MKYKKTIKKEKLQSLNIVLFLATSREEKEIGILKLTEREFYNNRKAVTGYSYYKPISKMLNGEFQ